MQDLYEVVKQVKKLFDEGKGSVDEILENKLKPAYYVMDQVVALPERLEKCKEQYICQLVYVKKELLTMTFVALSLSNTPP